MFTGGAHFTGLLGSTRVSVRGAGAACDLLLVKKSLNSRSGSRGGFSGVVKARSCSVRDERGEFQEPNDRKDSISTDEQLV